MQQSNQTPRGNTRDKKDEPISEEGYAKNPENVVKKPGKKDPKAGDATFDALAVRIDPDMEGRHEGEAEMDDENRTGGSSL
jgi:hypothetical protein